eukprot:ctg_714.g295
MARLDARDHARVRRPHPGRRGRGGRGHAHLALPRCRPGFRQLAGDRATATAGGRARPGLLWRARATGAGDVGGGARRPHRPMGAGGAARGEQTQGGGVGVVRVVGQRIRSGGSVRRGSLRRGGVCVSAAAGAAAAHASGVGAGGHVARRDRGRLRGGVAARVARRAAPGGAGRR